MPNRILAGMFASAVVVGAAASAAAGTADTANPPPDTTREHQLGSPDAGTVLRPTVQFFGHLDIAAETTRNGAGGSSVGLSSGVDSGSYLGLRAFTNVQPGLRVFAALEAGFDATTGSMKQYQGNYDAATPSSPGGTYSTGLFNRVSIVGLATRYGVFIMGRDYTPQYYMGNETDPMKLDFYGNLQQVVQLTGTGPERFAQTSNEVLYKSPWVHGFKVRAGYGFGSQSPGYSGVPTPSSPPPSQANHLASVSLSYRHLGLIVSGVYERLSVPVVSGSGTSAVFTGAIGTRSSSAIGAKYRFGRFMVGGGYLKVTQPMPDNNASDAWLGGGVKVGSGQVLAEVQHMKLQAGATRNMHADVYALTYVHSLEGAAQIYASYGEVRNAPNSGFGLVSGDSIVGAGQLGANVRGFAVGLHYPF